MTEPTEPGAGERRQDLRRAEDVHTQQAVKKAERVVSLFDIVVAFLVVVLLFVGWTAWQASRTARTANDTATDVRDLEIKNQRSNRATAFRLCTRNKVDRAFAHAQIRRQAPKLSRELMEPEKLPILDCDPNLDGKGAEPLPIALQVDFVDRWERGLLRPAELGICPGSRIGQTVEPDTC